MGTGIREHSLTCVTLSLHHFWILVSEHVGSIGLVAEGQWMELDGNGNSGTSAAFLEQLRERHAGPPNVIWDNALAHGGEAVREYLRKSRQGLRPVNLPGYSPVFNADEVVLGWVREEATGNLRLGTMSRLQERVGNFLAGLVSRKEDVKRRGRTILQSRSEKLLRHSQLYCRPLPSARPAAAFV